MDFKKRVDLNEENKENALNHSSATVSSLDSTEKELVHILTSLRNNDKCNNFQNKKDNQVIALSSTNNDISNQPSSSMILNSNSNTSQPYETIRELSNMSSNSSFSSIHSQKRDSNDAIYPQSKSANLNTSFYDVLPTPTPISTKQHKANSTSSKTTIPDKIVTCTCPKSKCLKLYCECLKAEQYCNKFCQCCNCHNNEEHKIEIEEAKNKIIDRDPKAFKKQAALNRGKNENGCNCGKSHCDNNYCSCHKAGIPCGVQCRCRDCHNK